MIFNCRLFSFFLLCSVSILLCPPVKAQEAPTKSEGQFGIKNVILRYVSVDVETSLDIVFVDANQPSVVTPSNIGGGVTSTKQAAIVKIDGAPFEAMINIESAEVLMTGSSGGSTINISSFTLAHEDALNSVMIMPFKDDKSYSIGVGGAVGVDHNIKEFYTGVNRLNINYL